MADIALHDDIDAFHRNPATGGGIALDDEKPAATGSTRILRGIPSMTTVPDIMFSATPAGRAVNGDGATIIHTGAVIADRTMHIDGYGTVDADGNGVMAARIDDFKFGVVYTS